MINQAAAHIRMRVAELPTAGVVLGSGLGAFAGELENPCVIPYEEIPGWPEATAYAASKAGLVALVKTLGRELAPEGIIVNGLAPGVTDTPQLLVDAEAAGVSLAEIHERYASDIPVRRIGRPEDLSSAVSLLCDFRLSAMVGQIVQVNGGTTRSRV